MTAVIRVTKDTFEQEVLKSDKPVIVDFYADWCGPCKTLAPRLEQVALERKDDVKIVKLDVEMDKEISEAYGVRAMPTLMIFKEGKIVETRTGGMSKMSLDAWIDAGIALPASEGRTPAQIKAEGEADKPLDPKDLEETLKEVDKVLGKSGVRGLVAAVTVPFALLPAVAGGLVLASGAVTVLPAVAAVGSVGAAVYSLYNIGKLLQPRALEKNFDAIKAVLNRKKGEKPEKPKKDAKYFAKTSLRLGFSLAKLGTAVALFAVAAPMTGFAAFGATTLAVWMAAQGGFGTLTRLPRMIFDVKEKIDHAFLKDIPPEEKSVALPAPQNAVPAPAVSAAEAGKDFAAAAKPAVNDNTSGAKPAVKPPVTGFR